MLRTAFSQARAAAQSSSRRLTSTSKPSRATFHRTNPDILNTTSFSPMNPGVTTSRPLPVPSASTSPRDTSNPAATTKTPIPTSPSHSPATPGPLQSTPAYMAKGRAALGSRFRVLDDIPILMKRFDVPETNIPTRFHSPITLCPLLSTPTPTYTSITRATLGSRSRVLDDIPSLMKRFDVPEANILTRFPPLKKRASEPIAKPPLTQSEESASGGSDGRPWFFGLPGWLRPREGTTYFASFAGEKETGKGKRKGMPNLVQYVLYGDPDPDGEVEAGVRKRSLWRSFLYGVSEEEVVRVDGEVGGAADVKGDDEVGEKGEREVVVVKKGEAEGGKTVAILEGGGYDMLAR